MSRYGEPARLQLLNKIHDILRGEPNKMYSKEEIMNRLAELNSDSEIESILGELEVASSATESNAEVYAKCRGGTVYYRWNKQ